MKHTKLQCTICYTVQVWAICPSSFNLKDLRCIQQTCLDNFYYCTMLCNMSGFLYIIYFISLTLKAWAHHDFGRQFNDKSSSIMQIFPENDLILKTTATRLGNIKLPSLVSHSWLCFPFIWHNSIHCIFCLFSFSFNSEHFDKHMVISPGH